MNEVFHKKKIIYEQKTLNILGGGIFDESMINITTSKNKNSFQKLWRKRTFKIAFIGMLIATIILGIVLSVLLTGNDDSDNAPPPNENDSTSTVTTDHTPTFDSTTDSDIPTSIVSTSPTISVSSPTTTDSSSPTTPSTPSTPKPLVIVSRSDWGAEKPTHSLELKTPVKIIIVGDIPKNASCMTMVIITFQHLISDLMTLIQISSKD